jgi:CubicO group peptidase (beta-lactamase class C family)
MSKDAKRLGCGALLILAIFALPTAAEEEPEERPAPTSFAELEERLGEVLEETNTPGLGIVVVSPEDVLWIAGIGKADVASGRAATPETLFRIGSTTKGFVSLALLKLQEEGRLRLEDTLESHAPEIEFENRWEESDPVRLVHLVEHTTGWDDIHLAEYASNDPKPVTTREGLDMHPDSRVARWRPGTRFSYCNSGPAVAAYVVEKITGQRFEEYVQEEFFDPLGMETATYFLTRLMERRGATLYRSDGVTPNDYWHISMRASGSINASARDMANYIRFYLQRGSFDGTTLLSPSSIERMEQAATTWGAEAGLEAGYGLSNYTSAEDAFVFHGHNGGVNGGLTEMAYLPDHGFGYAFMINSGNGDAYRQISELTRQLLIRGLAKPPLPPAVSVPDELADTFSGIYQPVTPRASIQQFADRIGGLRRLTIAGEQLTLAPLLGGEANEYVAVTERLARRSERSLTSLALLDTGSGGTYIEAGSSTYRRIPAWLAWAQIAWLLVAVVLMASSVLFALVWLPRRFFGKLKGQAGISVRVWPLVSVLAFVGFVIAFMAGISDPIPRLGEVTPYSLGQLVLSVLFAITALWGLLKATRSRDSAIPRVARLHSLLVAAASSSIALYLMYWGMIGLRTWSY